MSGTFELDLLFEASDGRGVLCWDFLDRSPTPSISGGSLIHGNELLFERDPDYPTGNKYRVTKHTLAAVRSALAKSLPRPMNPKQREVFRDGFELSSAT